MVWKKKRKIRTGTNRFYSISKSLKRRNKISSQFEVMLNSLTLEEVLALKLELGAKASGTPMFGFTVYRSLHSIVKYAVLMYALSATRTKNEAALFLGIPPEEFHVAVKDYQVERFFKDEEPEEKTS